MSGAGSTSGCDHQFHRLGAFALLVRLDVKCNASSCSQVLQSGPLDHANVNEHIAAAVIGLDEAIAKHFIEELDRTSHGHRETPAPYCTNRIENGRPILRHYAALVLLNLRWSSDYAS